MKKDFSIKNERILIFEPHPDDVAYQIMGTVIKWLQEKKDVYICTITKGDSSTFDMNVSKAEIESVMMDEHRKVHDMLGLEDSKLVQWDYPDQMMDPGTDRMGLMKRMVRLIRRIKPHTVVTMDPKNIHNEENPDHRIVAMTGFEAAAFAAYPNFLREQIESDDQVDQHFVSRVLFYMSPEPNVFIDIGGEIMEKKKEIGKIYRSQLKLMVHEIDARLRNMGLDPEVLELEYEDLWETLCESIGKEVAAEGNKFYQKNPELSPRVPLEFAESMRLYYLGIVEKLRDFLPKELLTI